MKPGTVFGGRLLLALAILSHAPLLRAAQCPGDPIEYTGYRVQRVRIVTPIQFFQAATFGFDELKQRLPLRQGMPFSVRELSEGQVLIREYVQSEGEEGSQKLKFVAVTGGPVDCDRSAQTLNVEYRLFTNIYRPYLSHTFEGRTAEVQRPATTGAEGGSHGRYMLRPFVGYDRARRGYGGADLMLNGEADYQHLELHPSFSSNSIVGSGAGRGSWNPNRKLMDQGELRLGFNYIDVPAGPSKLKEGKFYAQFSGSTRQILGTSIFRYGAALEGGHQQTERSTAPVVPDSSLGDIKLYLGMTGRAKRQSFTASYGVELGSTLNGNGLDFVRHVADAGYSVRFLGSAKSPPGGVHKLWSLEARAAGGVIQNPGAAPAAERFFGGNQAQPFIQGDFWSIPAGAFIRSIPENRLGSIAGGSLGGTRFYSGNLTLAKVLWGRPLLPAELAGDPDFLSALNFTTETAKGELFDYYKAKDPASLAAVSQLDGLATEVQQLTELIAGLPADVGSDTAVASAISAVRRKIRVVTQIIGSIRNGEKAQFAALVNVQLPALEREVTNLSRLLTQKGQPASATAATGLNTSIKDTRATIKQSLAAVDVKQAQARANQDFAVADDVLETFLHELNIYSIAPVALFDVARVWPVNMGTRYAVGGGVRLSIVNVNFTVAYAANPVRQKGEGPGALFFKLDVEDLFH